MQRPPHNKTAPTHPHTYSSYTPLSLSLSSNHTTTLHTPYTQLQTAPAASLHHHSPSGLHSLLAPTPPTLLLTALPYYYFSTLYTPHSTVSYFVRLIVTCPIAPVDSAKVGYSTLQSKAQTAGASTPQTLQGGLEECLNCCLSKTCVLGVATTTNDRPNTIWGVQTLGGEWIDRECSV